jgi:hypothetical protein
MDTPNGRNEGFVVLDEFVCQAIPAPDLSAELSAPRGHGVNEGVVALEDFRCQAVNPPDVTPPSTNGHPSRSADASPNQKAADGQVPDRPKGDQSK